MRQILDALEAYGLEWEGEVLFQSTSRSAHDKALEALLARGLAYPCGCSRKDLADAPRGPMGTIYPGTCRSGCEAVETAIRLRTSDDLIAFSDRLQGEQSQRLESESGDFVIRRRDGLIAYQLAVVVDDALEGITDIVRGIDIMDSTPRQIWLQQLLGYPTPDYAHIPVITHPDGDKLSKLTGAPGVPLDDVCPTLVEALAALQQSPPKDLASARLEDVWRWAGENWKFEKLQGLKALRRDQISANCLTVSRR